jgi:DNA-binding transcriptional ArsR family regulator
MREMAAVTSAPAPGRELQPNAPYPLAVSVVLDPQPSVVMLLRQAAGAHSYGAPAGLLTGVRDALRPQARFAARSLSGEGIWIPDCCTPMLPLAETSVADQAARMRDMPVTALTAELQAADGSRDYSRPRWRAAADQPRRWLNSMADASLDTWTAAEPRWRAAGPLLDREIRRIGTAAVRGGMTALLNSLHPRMSYHDGTFTFTCREGVVVRWAVGPRRLALVPMIAGRDALYISFDRPGSPGVFSLGYPVRPPSPGLQTTAESALATILSPVRAAILGAARQPLTVSQLAAAVHCAPSTATYHLHQLAAAGLITRQKSGPSVRVSRTARGSELVDLLSD